MANPRPIQRLAEEKPFHQKDALKAGIQGAMMGGAAGLGLSAIQNSLAKERVGAWGVFTRTGGTITSLTTLATVYSFSKVAAANLRQKDDTLNTTIGAFLGGAAFGLSTARIARSLGFGAIFAVVMSTFDYTGGSLRGKRTEVEGMDEYERKEYLRLNRRRPIEETIADIGEARGVKPPGYEERRRQRLKEKYGIDIQPVSALAE